MLRWMIGRGMEVTTGLFETAAFHQSVRTLEFLKDVSSPPSVHALALLPEASRGVCTISHGDAIFTNAPAIMIPVRARLFKEVATYLLEVGAKWDESCMQHVATGMMQFADHRNLRETLAHLLAWMRSEGAMAGEGDA